MLTLGQIEFVKSTNHCIRGTIIFIVAVFAITLLAYSYQELFAIYTLPSLVDKTLKENNVRLPYGPSKSSL